MERVYDIVIVGGGPAGISAAIEAVAMGVKDVLLCEKGENHSMTIRQFYKDSKRVDKDWNGQKVEFEGSVVFVDGTKESTIDFFDTLLSHHAIEARFHDEIESVIYNKERSLFEVASSRNSLVLAKNVIIAIGKMGKPNKPDYAIPPAIRSKITYNLDNCSQGEKILVVGGGNSAIEYAYDLAETNDVTLCYRQQSFTRLNAINLLNIHRAFDSGSVHPLLGVNILSLTEKEGQVEVHFDSQESRTFDRVIYGIGGTTPLDFLRKCSIELDEEKNPLLDDSYQTSIKGLYVSGDLGMKNGGSIGIALNMSYAIIRSIVQKG